MTFSHWKREKKDNWTVCVWHWKSGRSWCLPFDSTEAWGFAGKFSENFQYFTCWRYLLKKSYGSCEMWVFFFEDYLWQNTWWYDDIFQWIMIPIEGDWSHKLWGSALLEPLLPKPCATFGVLGFAEFTEKTRRFCCTLPPKTKVVHPPKS